MTVRRKAGPRSNRFYWVAGILLLALLSIVGFVYLADTFVRSEGPQELGKKLEEPLQSALHLPVGSSVTVVGCRIAIISRTGNACEKDWGHTEVVTQIDLAEVSSISVYTSSGKDLVSFALRRSETEVLARAKSILAKRRNREIVKQTSTPDDAFYRQATELLDRNHVYSRRSFLQCNGKSRIDLSASLKLHIIVIGRQANRSIKLIQALRKSCESGRLGQITAGEEKSNDGE